MNRLCLVGMLVLGLLIGSCVIGVGQAPRYGGTFRTAIPYEEIIGLDPLQLTIWNASSMGVIIQIHEGLMKWDTTTLAITPALAVSWEISEDVKTYTFYLREGVNFHNGREFVAQDVKYTIERMMDPELGGLHTYLFNGIVGVDEYRAGTADEISGAVVVSDYVLQITLKEVNVNFLHNLCEPGAVIVPQEEFEGMGRDAFNRAPIGAGPFKIVSWIGNEIKLEAYDDFWAGRPYLDFLEMVWLPESAARGAAFDAGELDVVVPGIADYVRYMADPVRSQYLIEAPELWTRHIGFNTEWGPFKDKRVRQAINYAIDQVAVAENYLQGQVYPATGSLPPIVDAYNPLLEGYGYDPEKAIELLTAAGYPNGFEFDVIGDPTDPTWGIPAAIAVMPYLDAVGITLNPIPTEYSAMVDMVIRGDFEAWVDAFGGLVSSLSYISNMHSSNIGTSNWARYNNPAVDALLDLAAATTDDETRIALIQGAEIIMVNDAPIFFNNYAKGTTAYQPWVHGIQKSPVDGSYQDYELVWVDETSPRADN